MEDLRKNRIMKEHQMLSYCLFSIGLFSFFLLLFLNPLFVKIIFKENLRTLINNQLIYRSMFYLVLLGIIFIVLGFLSYKYEWFKFLCKKRSLQNFLILFLMSFYLFSCGEVFIRAYLPQIKDEIRAKRLKPRFVGHPFLPYAGYPNDRRIVGYIHDFVGKVLFEYNTNSYGFLGDEFKLPKKPESLRIITLGGSTTWSMGIDLETKRGNISTTWPSLLEERIKKDFPELEVDVYNLALDAATSPMSLIILSLIGLKLEPDIVIAYDGINDAAMFFNYKTKLDYSNAYKDFSLQNVKSVALLLPEYVIKSYFVCAIVKIIDKFYGYESKNFYEAIIPDEKRKQKNWYETYKGRKIWWDPENLKGIEMLLAHYRTMSNMCKSENIYFTSATLHYFERNAIRNQINSELRKFFEENEMIFFDADKEMPKGDKTVNVDLVHFTKKGNKLMAEGFYKTIKKIIYQKIESKEP